MLQPDNKTKTQIDKICRENPEIKLTIGVCDEKEKCVALFDQTGSKSNVNLVYEIGAITKVFTACLFAKLVTDGKMDIDDLASDYISDLGKHGYYPSLRSLATHSAGYHGALPYGSKNSGVFGSLFRKKSRADKAAHLLDFESMLTLIEDNKVDGRRYPWVYSSFGYAILGYAVGVAAGNDYKTAMDDFLLNELALKHSYTGIRSGVNIKGYNPKTKAMGNLDYEDSLMSPAGAISSTAEDLLEFALENIHAEKPYLSLCHEKQVESKHLNMGLGWILPQRRSSVLFHNGSTDAFSSFIAIDTDKKVATVALCNTACLLDEIGFNVFTNLQRKYYTEEELKAEDELMNKENEIPRRKGFLM